MIEFCGVHDVGGRYSNCHEAIYKLRSDERRCDFPVRFIKAKQHVQVAKQGRMILTLHATTLAIFRIIPAHFADIFTCAKSSAEYAD
jgi:hypothetical protein